MLAHAFGSFLGKKKIEAEMYLVLALMELKI